ncbi:MAG: OmpA family protein [Phycisphaerales bacterium]
MRFDTIRRFGLLAATAVLSLGLGACNKDKEALAQLQSENEQLRAENAGLKDTNGSLTAQNQQLLSDLANSRQAQPTFTGNDPYAPAPRGGSGAPDVARLTVAGDVLFASGSDSISAAGKRELDKIASTIKRQYAGNSIRVEGYTDSDPIRKSKWGTNDALSAARAAAVERYLVSRGISASRIESVGMGSAKPKATKAASRRVEIVILG